MPRFARLPALALVLATATAAGGIGGPAGAVPPRGAATGPAIEEPARYQEQFLCTKALQPGVKAFRDLVLSEYPKTRSVSEVRTCSAATTSEHQDGRAWDWGVNVKKKKERRTAEAVFGWLLAPDEFGNEFAMARRLGLMYMIWDKKIWRAYSGTWGSYPCSGVTDCHKDHVHFSFGWAGALKKTSYWTGDVSPVVPPPIPVFTSVDGEYATKVKAKAGEVWGKLALAGGLAYQVQVSGVWGYGTKDHQQADAACRQNKDGTWTPERLFRASGLWRLTPTTDTGGGCNTVDHTYIGSLAPQLTDAISFAITEGSPKNNSGALNVSIRRAQLLPTIPPLPVLSGRR